MANQISVNTGSGAGAQQVIVDSNGNITVTVSRSVIGTVANVASANYANFAGNVVNAAQPNITSVGNLTNLNVTGNTTTGNLVVVGNLQVGNLVANSANYANFAGVAYSVAGANVSGAVANATFATSAGTANTANTATVANSANTVAGANVTGTVANATFATTAGSANTANSAIVANSANAVAGANVSGTVANATYALDAGNANFANSATVANSANSIALANVSGAGNIASINLDGSSSNVLYGNGIFAPAAGGNTTNANYANFAGNVINSAQPNITSVGTLTALTANTTTAIDLATTNANVIANVFESANLNTRSALNHKATWSNNQSTMYSYAQGVGVYIANIAPGNVGFGNLKGVWQFGTNGNLDHIFGGTGNVNAKGANIAGNITVGGFATSTFGFGTNANVSASNVTASANVQGNVILGNYLYGDGSNISNIVATNANYANFAGSADFANYVGYAVENTSTSSHLVSFVAPGFTANKQVLINGNFIFNPSSETLQVQNVDSTIIKAAQPNITSVGDLTSLTVTGNLNANGILFNSNTSPAIKISVADDLSSANARNLNIRAGNVTTVSVSNTIPGAMTIATGGSLNTNASSAWIARAGSMVINTGTANTANGNATGGAIGLQPGGTTTGVGTALGGALNFFTGGATSNNGGATSGAMSLGFAFANATNGTATINGITIGNALVISSNGNANINTFNINAGSGNATNGNFNGGQFNIVGANARTITAGNAFGGNITISGGPARSENGNATSGNITIQTSTATANVGSGTATVGSINVEVSAPNGVTANVKGNINIGTNNNANAINIGASGVPTKINGNLDANIVNATYLYGDGSNITGIAATNANYANFAGNVINSAQPNITSVGTLTGLDIGTANALGAFTLNGSIAQFSPSPTTNTSMSSFIYGDGAGGQEWLFVRRRNGNSTARQGLVANDYLGNITWTGARNVAGSSFGVAARIAPRVDGSYTGPGTTAAVPIGFELQVVDSNNTPNLHYFYANGNVQFNNVVNANIVSANYLYGDGSNITGISGGNATPAGSNTEIQFNNSGNFGASSALTFDSATNQLGVDGNVIINTTSGVSILVNTEDSNGISSYNMHSDTSVFPVQNFYRTRGNIAAPTAVSGNDTIFTQNYGVYADGSNTYVNAGYQENKVGTNYGNGQVSLVTTFFASYDGSTFNVDGYDTINLNGYTAFNNNVYIDGINKNISLFGANTGGGDISSINLINGALNWTLDNTQFSGGTPFGMTRYNTGFLEPLNYFTARGSQSSPADVQVGDTIYSERMQVLYNGTTHNAFNGDLNVRSFSPSNAVAATYSIGSYDDQANSVFQVNFGTSNIAGDINATGRIEYLRTFGSFTSNATQTSNGANTTNLMTFNNTEDANGISIVSNTQLTVARTGRYNLQFSAQVEKTDSGNDLIEIWLRKNGNPVANTATQLTLVGNNAKSVAAWDFNIDAANVNDYFELAWASPDTNVQLTAIDSGNTISGVALPSVIVDINPIGA